MASHPEIQCGVHPVTVWQLSWSVAAGTSQTTQQPWFSCSHAFKRRQSYHTRLARKPHFSSFCVGFDLVLRLNCSSTLRKVQEVCWETARLPHKLKGIKVWNCWTFGLKRFLLWFDGRWPNYGWKAETVARILVTIHGYFFAHLLDWNVCSRSLQRSPLKWLEQMYVQRRD